MTPKQTSYYWRAWGEVRKAKPDADRHALHIEALGEDCSMKDLTNAQFDKVLGVFQAISKPADLNGQVRQIRQPRERAMHGLLMEAMRCLGVYVQDPMGYAEEVCRSRFGTADLEFLTDDQLHQLRMTLWNRVNARAGLRNKAGHSLHDMYLAAKLRCPCAGCAKARQAAEVSTAEAVPAPMVGPVDEEAVELAREMSDFGG